MAKIKDFDMANPNALEAFFFFSHAAFHADILFETLSRKENKHYAR